MHRIGMALCAGIMASLLFAPASGATWSIVGVDPETGEVGVAIASCVPVFALGELSEPLSPVVLVPGVGAGVTQAELNEDAAVEISSALRDGADAAAAIDRVIAPSFDRRSAHRQHGVVTLAGETATFTGAETSAVAGDRSVNNGSVQGNILVSDAVLDDAIAAYQSTSGDLSERLTAGLQAGADAGGDSRCGEQTALFAHLAVAKPGDDARVPSVLLTFGVADGSVDNPVDQLSAAVARGERQLVSDTSGLPIVGVVVLLIGALVVLAAAIAFGVWLIRRRRQSRAGNL